MNATLLIELDNFLKQNKLSLNNDDFDFITDINWKTPLNIKCLNCGCEFNITTK